MRGGYLRCAVGYIGACVTADAVTLLDINNTVPQDIFDREITGKYPLSDHGYLYGISLRKYTGMQASQGSLKYMLIQNRLLENSGTPDFTRGHWRDIQAGAVTFTGCTPTPDGSLQAYISQGEVLPAATRSFGELVFLQFPRWQDFIDTY